MDRDYAELSFRIGHFARKADDYLGYMHFVPKIRTLRWTLTEQMLRDFEQEARALGVPDEVMAFTADDAASLSAMLETGLRLQDLIDRRTGINGSE